MPKDVTRLTHISLTSFFMGHRQTDVGIWECHPKVILDLSESTDLVHLPWAKQNMATNLGLFCLLT